MLLTCKNGVFIAICSYEEKNIPEEAGFSWNKLVKRKWASTDINKVLKIKQYADKACKKEIDRIISLKKELLEASKALDADIKVPVPEGLNYMPFQKAGIKFISERRNFLLADPTGTGKTVQALGLINLISDINKILIVSPSTAKINWYREAKKWLVRNLSVSVLTAKDEKFPETDMIIMNYDLLTKFSNEVHNLEWDLLIADECQALKSDTSQRSKEIFGFFNKKKNFLEIEPIPATRKGFLSATPMRNRPIELWSMINYLDPNTWKNQFSFGFRYCGGKKKRFGSQRYNDFSGSSNEEELQERLRSTIMIRREKSEVLKELPPKRRQIIELPAEGLENFIQDEISSFEEYEAKIKELKNLIEKAKITKNTKEYNSIIKELKLVENEPFNNISGFAVKRKKVAMAKLPFVVEHVKSLIEDETKVVVFAYHHNVIDALKKELGDIAVTLTGRENEKEKQAAIDRFNDDPKCLILIGNIIAAGTAINLTISSHVLIIELVWVPSEVTQAEDRTFRIGQSKSVLIQHLVLENSLDVYMAKQLIEKQEIATSIFDYKVLEERYNLD